MTGEQPQIDRPQVTEEFYKGFDIYDEELLANLDEAVNLYLEHYNFKGMEATQKLEKSLGIFSLSFVKMLRLFTKEDKELMSPQRKLLMNFGALDSRLAPNSNIFESIVDELLNTPQNLNYEIHYLDEWLDLIARGSLPLTSDAAGTSSKTNKMEQEERLMKKLHDIKQRLTPLRKQEVEIFHYIIHAIKGYDLKTGKPADRYKTARALRQAAARLESITKDLFEGLAEMESLRSKLGTGDDESLDTAEGGRSEDQMRKLRDELNTLIAVCRSCAVRGGFVKNTPIIIDKFISMDRLTLMTKEFADQKLAELEQLDPTIFTDKLGRRNPPKILIIPGIGTGMAYYDRIILPLISPPNMPPEVSMARTLAGYRWYRTTASFTWRDIPGELGSAYCLVYPGLDYGKLTKQFIDEYVDWTNRESLGYQVLNPEVRKIFWRFIPFPKAMKETLSKRAVVYSQLYAQDRAKDKKRT